MSEQEEGLLTNQYVGSIQGVVDEPGAPAKEVERTTGGTFSSLFKAVWRLCSVTLRAAISRGPGGPTGPPRTPSRTPWTLSI
jgi:hypothetical protein